MSLPIDDEFARLPISRQRKYQLRRRREGRPVLKVRLCLKHPVEAQESQRHIQGLKRRGYGTLSYKLEAAA